MEIRDIEKNETINLVIKQDAVQENEISLRDIFGILSKGKRVIAIFTLVAFIVSLLAALIYGTVLSPSSGTVRALISFNYDGVDKGLDPHGKALDIEKIKAPVVIDKVMESKNLYERKLTTEDIRKNISIQGIIPTEIINKVLTVNKMAEKDVTKLEELEKLEYHPTQYLVTMDVSKELGLSSTEAKAVLNEVLYQYKNYFSETYSDKDVLSSTVGEMKYEDYDYPEVARVMKGQIDIIKSYLGDKNKKSPDFRAKSTQMSFGDIISYMNILEEVDISRVSSLIFSYNLTKDKNRLLSLYEYRIEQNQVSMAKKTDESRMAQSAVDKYQKDKSLILMPGMTGEGASSSLEFDQKNEYYNQLLDRALDQGVAATNFTHDIAYYKKVIEKLNKDTISGITKQTYMREVDGMILNISDNLKNWVNIANKTVDEYYETEIFKNAVKIAIPAEYDSAMSANLKMMLMLIAGVTVLGFFVGTAFVFLRQAVLPDKNNIAC